MPDRRLVNGERSLQYCQLIFALHLLSYSKRIRALAARNVGLIFDPAALVARGAVMGALSARRASVAAGHGGVDACLTHKDEAGGSSKIEDAAA